VAEVLHPDDREPTRRFWLESVAGHHAYDIEYRVRHRNGEYRWFKTRGAPIRDTGGNIVKWFGTCTDITELRDSEERFRGTFENAAVGIGHRHLDGRFLRVNQKFCTILGYPRDELLQRTGQEITHPDDLDAGVDLAEALLRGESPGFTLEKRYVRRDGSPVWVELSVSLQRDGAGKPDGVKGGGGGERRNLQLASMVFLKSFRYLRRTMLVTHALNTLILLSGQRLAGGIQRAQRKHKAKCNPFLQCEIQPFQLTDRKQHNNDIIKNRQ